jgi:hypothetical protein
MRFLPALLIAFLFLPTLSLGQFIIPGEGIMDVKTGTDRDELEWELGFTGKRIEKTEASPEMTFIAESAGIDFDFVVSYQHIMWLPVKDVFFKDGKINLVSLSSYPEYNQMICGDIGTVEGLNFWQNANMVQEIYGNTNSLKSDDKTFLFYPEKGIGTELSANEVRTIFIFPAQMK